MAEAGLTGQLALDVGEPDEEDPISAAEPASCCDRTLGRLLEADRGGRDRTTPRRGRTPAQRVLARMEVTGVAVDIDELRSIVGGFVCSVRDLEKGIHRLAGEEFNVNSTPQLRTILYDKLGLSPGRKTKTGFSTNAATLEKLRGVHPIIDAILSYREVEKLRSTYGESLLAEVAPDGRIHASFNQTVARTGRISSDHPNLHNIPVAQKRAGD